MVTIKELEERRDLLRAQSSLRKEGRDIESQKKAVKREIRQLKYEPYYQGAKKVSSS
jgi:hypothetical protein